MFPFIVMGCRNGGLYAGASALAEKRRAKPLAVNGGDPLAGRRPFGVDALARKGGSFVSLIGGGLSD